MAGISQQIALSEPSLAAANEEAATAEQQFAELVRRQSRFVFRVAYSVLRNAHDAEDVVQEAFLKLHRNQTWKHIDDEKAFLARATWRLAVQRSQVKPPDSSPAEQACTRETPEERTIRIDRDALVHRFMEALPEELRLPLVLSAIEGLRSQDIAKIMEVPEGTVRSRIARARKILKERLAALLEGHHA